MKFTRFARPRDKSGIDQATSGNPLAYRRRFRESVRRRTLVLEPLEARELLTVAQDLAAAIAPYQPALTSALDSATQLPLVRNQLTGLSEFATALQNTEASINSQTQNVTADGHYQVTVPLPSLSKTFRFDLGLDAFLKATAAGSVHAEIDPTLTIGFDVTGGAASLDVGQTRLDIGFGLSLPGFQGTFSLNGLLFTKAVDAGTRFNGDLGFQFASGGALDAQFSGAANVLLDLSMSFVDPALNASFNPTFRTTLDVDWAFGANNQLAAPNISLVNVGLEADSFLRGFLGDVVKTAQKFTKPIQPFVDVFQTPVPILSAFDSSETIGTLMLKGAGASSAQQDGFKLMVQIINAVNAIDLSGNTGRAVIPFGTIAVTGNPQQAGGFGFNTSSVSTAVDDIFDVPALQTVEDALRKVGNYAGTTSTAGFQFPLLENPGSVIAGILLGQPDTTLFSFSTGRQHFELAPSLGVGIPGVLGIFLSAGIIFDANLTMGYDTAGLLAYAQDPNNAGKLLHGFYFDNSIDTSVPPVEGRPPVRKTGLYLQGQMELKADALLARASGGLYANIIVELVNTDATNRVHLDTMIGNLTSGGKVFKLGGKLYASADVSLELSLPIGPDITLFSFNLAHEELLNFDPAPAPGGVPLTVIDVVDQHTLLLDVGKMVAGSVVTVQPFHDTTVSVGGNTFEADGIRVDYPGEIALYVERRNNANTNYYNLIALNGAAPDRVSINVIDPFRVFADEGAANPSPAQTKPAVMLVGGKDVTYSYAEAPDGSQAIALLVGGYGSNTLTGGTMTFGNFIPGDRIAQAKGHLADVSGFDGVGQGLINSQIDAGMAPASPAGIIGAKMTGGRGGLMMGGPGNNSFIAMGAGVYEMIGGAWVNSLNISPSFGDGPASYQIDGGPFGQSSLIVRVPTGEMADFENGTVPDKYNPAFKALDVYSNAGLFATAHGIQKVIAVGSPGSMIVIGDTSEVDIDIAIRGSRTMKFGGSPQPGIFDVSTRYDVVGFYGYGTRNHRTMAIESRYANGDVYYLYPGDTASPNDAGYVSAYQYVYVDGPFYTIARTFGTNNRTQSIELNVNEVASTSLVLDGRGGADQYHIAVGLGSFLDIVIDDTDPTTQNSLLIDSRKSGFINHRAILTDNSLHLEFYTPITAVHYGLGRYVNYMSVSYSPTFYFGANADVTFAAAAAFVETTINRPAAPQNASILYDGISTGSMIAIDSAGATAYDPEQPNGQMITATSATIDVQANAGTLSLQPRGMTNVGSNPGALLNVHSNSGSLSVLGTHSPTDLLGALSPHTFNIFGNTGTIDIDFVTNLYSGVYLNYQTHVINVFGNAGTINLHDALYPWIIAYGIDAQVNVGDGGSLANIHGAINLSHAPVVLSTSPNDIYSIAGRYGLRIDDRNNPGPGGPWTIDAAQTRIGDLTINYGGVNTWYPYRDIFSRYEVFTKAGSTVTVFSDPPFDTKQINDSSFPAWQLTGPSPYFSVHDGEAVNVASTIGGDPGGAVTFAATNLPPGLSIDPSTGVISGAIAPRSYLASPYLATIVASNGTIFRGLQIRWDVGGAISMEYPPYEQYKYEGTMINVGPFTATSNLNEPVTLAMSGLPPGLSFSSQTGMVSGVIEIGAAQTGPYQVTIEATDGIETVTEGFVWQVTGITIGEVESQRRRTGESVYLVIHATTVSGQPVVFSAENLPVGLSIDSETGVISGIVANEAYGGPPYSSVVYAAQGNDVQGVEIVWEILPDAANNAITLLPIGTQQNREGDHVDFQISATSSLWLPLAYSAEGLPPGIQIDGGYFSGEISAGAASSSPYRVTLAATDGVSSAETSFDWFVTVPNTVTILKPNDQKWNAGATISSFDVQATSSLGTPLNFSASGLPSGLSIDPSTGIISGIIERLPVSPAVFDVVVTATDGTSASSTSFLVEVYGGDYAFPYIVELPNPAGAGLITISGPPNTWVTAEVTAVADPAPPGSLQFPFGFISFTVVGQYPGALLPRAAMDVTITLPAGTTATNYYRYGPTPGNSTPHWYNFLYQQQTEGEDAGTTGAVIDPNGTIVLHLVDGGRGDDDLSGNGIIFDLGGPAIGNIDQLPTLGIDSVTVTKPASGTTQAVFTVALSSNPTEPVTVRVNTADGTASAAGGDYQAINDLLLTFQPGDPLTKAVAVTINGRSAVEPDRTYFVNLSSATGATIAGGLGVGTIHTNDEAATTPALKIGGPAAAVRAQTLSFLFTIDHPVAGFPARARALANATASFNIAIEWGDRRYQTIVLAAGDAAQSLTHTYSTAGAFTITATAADESGQVHDTATYRVSIGATGLMPDPSDPGKMSLFVGGTPGNDSISIVKAARGQVQVRINGKNQGKFTVTGGLFIYGGAGNDTLSVATNIKLPALLDGGPGNDILRGGGNNILLGGRGNDRLFGSRGYSLLIGGRGADMLFARSKGDILIGGATAFDADYESLQAIMYEWNSGRKYKARAANLRGSGGGSGANGTVRLVTTGHEATIFDDGANDVLRGGAGQDWFFAKRRGAAKDRIVGRRAGELAAATRRDRPDFT
jgi:hypothetical protein